MPAVPRPVVPIGSFFNASRMLVWPSDAPVAGDLIVKRDISDQACLEVADLVDKHGSAPITTVTSTRQKLLDYGQPALHFMRTHTTPRVAETFHLFLLSLYESLAQAANPSSGCRPDVEFHALIWKHSRPAHGPRSRETTVSRFLRDRSICTTVPSRPIKTFAGISATP